MLSIFLGSVLPFIGKGFSAFMEAFQDKRDKAHELALSAQEWKFRAEIAKEKTEQSAIDNLGKYVGDMTNFSIETSKPVGIKFVDAITALVRPIITYAIFAMYVYLVISLVIFNKEAGTLNQTEVLNLWEAMCAEIFSFIISYWFGERGARRIFDRKIK